MQSQLKAILQLWINKFKLHYPSQNSTVVMHLNPYHLRRNLYFCSVREESFVERLAKVLLLHFKYILHLLKVLSTPLSCFPTSFMLQGWKEGGSGLQQRQRNKTKPKKRIGFVSHNSMENCHFLNSLVSLGEIWWA